MYNVLKNFSNNKKLNFSLNLQLKIKKLKQKIYFYLKKTLT